MLTDLQMKLANLIAINDYTAVNGAVPECFAEVDEGVWFWADEFAGEMGISEQALGGVVTSMKNEQLLYTEDEGTEDAYIGLTEKGFAAWQAQYNA